MVTIIAGGRKFDNFSHMCIALEPFKDVITEVVSGHAPGADKLGEAWAKKNGIPIKRFPADWKRYGNSAGPIRNRQMALYAEALIAFWNGESVGTKNMIDQARFHNLRVKVIMLDLT